MRVGKERRGKRKRIVEKEKIETGVRKHRIGKKGRRIGI